MSDSPIHVVFGTGQVGVMLAGRLAARGIEVRTVSRRRRPATLAEGVDWRSADVTDPEAAIDAAKGPSVVYQCLNAPYTDWPSLFPPLQRGVLGAAEHADALLVSLENLYGYGPTGGKPLTEDVPLAATTSKGRTRAAMTAELLAAAEAGRVCVAIGRASDFFGPGVTDSSLGARVFGNALAGKRADFIGNPGLAHTYSYVPDIAAGLATLGTDERAVGQVWHLPGPETITTRMLLDLIADEVGHPVGVRTVPKLVMRALGLVNPLMRELSEMAYEFEEPFILDTAKFQSTFATSTTTLTDAIGRTIAWYRTQKEPNMTPSSAITELAPAAAWSQRVRRVGGFIQVAFAAFWLVRGARGLGGGIGTILAVIALLSVGLILVYAIRVTAGTGRRPTGTEAKRIERSVTTATVMELVASLALPLIVIGAGHPDWVLPSIAVTIGPLLLWLDHLVDIPRYRLVGWALTIGPIILVATMSGTSLTVTTGLTAGALLLGTATAGFHDLAGLRPSRPVSGARLDTPTT
jgi:nucleoside-diphosphate-sugar epimerase